MALPKQVEQQLKEVEELERSLTAQPEAAETQTEPQTDPQPAEGTPTEATEQTNVVELKQPEPTPDWEQKYKSLKGHFDAEVPRLHAQNKELAAQLQQLQQTVESLKQQPAPTAAEPERLVTADDEEHFGADMIDVQRRVAKEVMREYVTPLQGELKAAYAKIGELETALNRTGGEVATMTFEQKLSQTVPDFAEINADPKWIAWLDELDPYTGNPRRAWAEYVYNKGDVAAVKKVVDFYKSSANPQVNERQVRQKELERQVTPTRANTASSTPSAADRIYTEAEVNRLFNKVRELNVSGKYEEASRLENELSAAYMQGRVRP